MGLQPLARLAALLLAVLPALGAATEANASDLLAPAGVEKSSAADSEASSGGEQTKRRHCQPKHDKHGVWTGSTKPGGEYVLTCDPGFAVDKERTVTLTCSEDEVQWNADPWCENVDDCAERMYGCGPAGLCVDHVGYSECICERGAVVREMSNGEEVCYFKNETKHCGGRNCGAHGICVDLTQYQQSFDTGDSSFRCSCERGFEDDGSTCKPVDCGERFDAMGTWSGSSTYLGEYTLECKEGAFVLGGTQKAITVSCPADGRWESASLFSTHPPKCLSPTQALHDARLATFRFWLNVFMSLCCICGAAMAAGLTMGLLSLEPREMEIIQRARLHDCLDDKERERLEKQKDAARHILPLIKDHHLLLVTLLLLNALANEALPIFLDQLVSPFVAVLLSVTFVLMCGEILPSAVFTGPLQLTISSMFIPCVRVLVCTLYVISKPIAVILDHGLPHKSAEEELYSRPEIRAVLTLHSQGPEGSASRSAASSRPDSTSSQQGLIGAEPLFDQESPPADSDVAAPLDPLEAQICFGILDLGELQVAESQAFRSLRRCSSAFHAALQSTRAASAAWSAASAGAEAVVVFRSLELVKWPVEVPLEELLGVVRLPDLLVAAPGATLAELCAGQSVAQVEAAETVTNALCALANACGTPCSFAAVIQRCEFMGLIDGEDALSSLLTTIHKQDSAGSLGLSPAALPREAADAVCEALVARGDIAESVPAPALSPVNEDSPPAGRETPTKGAASPNGAAATPASERQSEFSRRRHTTPLLLESSSGAESGDAGSRREAERATSAGVAAGGAAGAPARAAVPELPGALATGSSASSSAGQEEYSGAGAVPLLPTAAAVAAAGAAVAAGAVMASHPGPELPEMPETPPESTAAQEAAAPPAAQEAEPPAEPSTEPSAEPPAASTQPAAAEPPGAAPQPAAAEPPAAAQPAVAEAPAAAAAGKAEGEGSGCKGEAANGVEPHADGGAQGPGLPADSAAPPADAAAPPAGEVDHVLEGAVAAAVATATAAQASADSHDEPPSAPLGEGGGGSIEMSAMPNGAGLASGQPPVDGGAGCEDGGAGPPGDAGGGGDARQDADDAEEEEEEEEEEVPRDVL